MSTYRYVLQGVVGAVSAQTGAVDQRIRQRVSEKRDEFDHSPFGLAFENRTGQAYNEEAFLYFLEIERQRAELSGHPFLLLLVDLKRQGGTTPRMEGVADKLFAALSICLRETDFTGWYHEGRVAGAVLTQHAGAPVRDLPEVVRQRISAALRQGLPAGVADRVRVTVYQLPMSLRGEVNG
jgi:hypothetical protein